ncbi:putative methyltransferase-domain-containing protein [Halteromyces radiatus]|uniref:putative methyltransferase-domain-containing protein n=1 Tax=Halteromyces radiatus TaxID=101107 RepID=UPI00221E5009|nr:putative methyltransferase-domain-containing protein [Halteromyces radiatus]KAI8093290.1 putative methyltransferase-domain-containing protein [Halteromyces radiatus]
MNLRSPLIQKVTVNQWYRVEVFLVNEIGLFKRADIEPDGCIYLGCELLVPASSESLTPLKLDTTCNLTIRATTWSGTDTTLLSNTSIPGFFASGKGSFEYTITPKKNQEKVYECGPRYLRIYCQSVENFPQHRKQDEADNNNNNKLDDWILPLVVGPIELSNDSSVDNNNGSTNATVETWPENTPMVHSAYRLFSSATAHELDNSDDTTTTTTFNVAIHESWESGIPGKIWDSALVMLQMLERMVQYKPNYLNGKHVLDLSAGTGLLGLSVAKNAKPSKVTITELDEAVDLIKSNISLNDYLNKKCNDLQVRKLLWGDDKQAQACGKADMILASDVLYEAEFFEDLIKSFVDLCNQKEDDGGKIFIGYKRRGFDAHEEIRFWNLCRQYFDVTLLNEHPSDEDACLVPPLAFKSGVQLYRLTPSL